MPRLVVLDLRESAIERDAHALVSHDIAVEELVLYCFIGHEDGRDEPLHEGELEFRRGAIVNGMAWNELGKATATAFAEKVMLTAMPP